MNQVRARVVRNGDTLSVYFVNHGPPRPVLGGALVLVGDLDRLNLHVGEAHRALNEPVLDMTDLDPPPAQPKPAKLAKKRSKS